MFQHYKNFDAIRFLCSFPLFFFVREIYTDFHINKYKKKKSILCNITRLISAMNQRIRCYAHFVYM